MGKFSKPISRKAIINQSLNQKNIEINAITNFFKSKSHTKMAFCVNILSRTQVKRKLILSYYSTGHDHKKNPYAKGGWAFIKFEVYVLDNFYVHCI